LRRLEDCLNRWLYVLEDRFSAADLLIASALNFVRAAFPESTAL
jgi:glutathione S-transferase